MPALTPHFSTCRRVVQQQAASTAAAGGGGSMIQVGQPSGLALGHFAQLGEQQ